MKKKICVVGSGNWGLNHVRTLSNLGSLGGIVETNLSRLNELRIEFPDCDFYSSLDLALKKPFNSKEEKSKLVLPSILPLPIFFLGSGSNFKNLLIGLASTIEIFFFFFF